MVSKEATHNSVYYGRVIIGVLTILGAGFFAVALIESSASVSTNTADYDYRE